MSSESLGMMVKDMEITAVLSADVGGGVKESPKWRPFKSLPARLHFEQFALSSFNTTHKSSDTHSCKHLMNGASLKLCEWRHLFL